ncbi:carnitine palmitoyltransferase II [Capsaspora owczarzaki ATCC 30864]|uniref:Carnitine palmitoyltransferase II n=1 Tax=Capsaspora owczarzaki (strain ATCC 30864) TaxID=595528 RepID=A0A0D2WPF3_CAPO3|nr:carnitine palmitoyltransferase II [Capsaspora owczarzaki ATCC 30864]KJE93240.1 carnitine palmitoyltransferase II [Capsaspora owczarzaki ATCC 30864]|eukprot:XP_004347880.1 carnitine palmitoyltransferase II [Capsaspora owczarzaki ATCC 30864]
MLSTVGRGFVAVSSSAARQARLSTSAAAASAAAARLEGEFIQRSVVPTMHFQPSLPRLPVPKLEDTLTKYLAAVRPLVSVEEYETTVKAVNSFRKNEAPGLHDALVASDKANKHTSYISAPWFEMYLETRDPVVVNVNPFIAFLDDPKPENQKQASRATNMITSSIRFLNALKKGVLAPDVFHLNPEKSDTDSFKNIVRWIPSSLSWYYAYMKNAYPLDMSQYARLFASTRIPRVGRDELLTADASTVRHVVILRRGHVWKLTVRDEQGKTLPSAAIRAAIESIQNDTTPRNEHPVAALTSEERDTWARLRDKVLAISDRNRASLAAIDSGLFVIALDDKAPTDPCELSRAFLVGDPATRWYDKSFSLLMEEDGKTAINFEHSWGDGVAVLRYFNEVFGDTTKAPIITGDVPAGAAASLAQRLDFDLNDEIKTGIRNAIAKYQKLDQSLDIKTMEYHGFGKDAIKRHKLSPDGVAQMAFQLAYTRMYGKTGTTYESCSTAAFKHGRTECIRSASMDSVEFVKSFLDPKASNETRIAKLRQAVSTHSELTKNAAMGVGCDRHLFALKYLANKQGLPTPAIFTDKAYKVINHNVLSTSTLASPALLVGGFGPVVADGFGLGYMVDDNRIGTHVTAFHKDTDKFCASLKQSVEDIHKELGKSPVPTKQAK